jgi:hypothetical protein
MTCASKIALKSFFIVFIFASTFFYNKNDFLGIEGNDISKEFGYTMTLADVNKEEPPKRYDHLKDLR